MMGKTHLAVGISTAMTLLQPRTPAEFIIATIGGAAGAVMADIDVKIEDRRNALNMDGIYTDVNTLVLIASLLAFDFFKTKAIWPTIINHWQTSLAGLAIMIVLIIIGRRSEHRTFTHSIVGLILYTFAAAAIHIEIGVAFFLGYASHLLIDLLNKSPIPLLYPIQKKGVCFKICYASRWGNEILFSIGLVLISISLLIATI